MLTALAIQGDKNQHASLVRTTRTDRSRPATQAFTSHVIARVAGDAAPFPDVFYADVLHTNLGVQGKPRAGSGSRRSGDGRAEAALGKEGNPGFALARTIFLCQWSGAD